MFPDWEEGVGPWGLNWYPSRKENLSAGKHSYKVKHTSITLAHMHVDLLCQQALTQHTAGSLRKLDVAI